MTLEEEIAVIRAKASCLRVVRSEQVAFLLAQLDAANAEREKIIWAAAERAEKLERRAATAEAWIESAVCGTCGKPVAKEKP